MVVNATLPVNGTAACELSPHAAFFSTVLGTIVSTIIAGVTGGRVVPVIVGLTSWLATLRIITIGLWQVGVVLLLKPTKGGEQWYVFARYIIHPLGESDFVRGEETSSDNVNILGWIGWVWSVLYAPPIQVLWFVKNWNSPLLALSLIRGVSISVVALPLTMDTKALYGTALGKWGGGKFTEWLFSVVTTVSLVTLGVISTIEISLSVLKHLTPSNRWQIAVGVSFLVMWGWASLSAFPPLDVPFGGSSPREVLHGAVIGCCATLFVALPQFILMEAASRSPGMSIRNYITCSSVPWWERAIAVLP